MSAPRAGSAKRARSAKPPPSKPGRPLKLSAELQERMVQALKTGCHVEVAAEFAGIGTTTYYRWMALGREQPDGQYGRFRAAVENALAAAEVHSLATLRAAFAQRPDMILAFLARRHPERWAAQPRHGEPQGDPPGTRGADSLEIRNPAVRLHLSAALEESRKEHERAD